MEETLQDNTQLREDLAALRKQNEKLKKTTSPGSPGAPGGGRAESAAAANVSKMKDKVEVLHQTVRDLAETVWDFVDLDVTPGRGCIYFGGNVGVSYISP